MNCTELDQYVATQVSQKRLAHCRSTARQTQSLLNRFASDMPKDAGWAVGIWHDVARQWSDGDLLAYCIKHRIDMEHEEQECPMLLHGAVAAHLLPCDHTPWKVAIRWHTIGSERMGVLGAALYIADYLEPLRTHLTREERLYILGLDSLERMCLAIIDTHRGYLARKGKRMARSTEWLEQFLQLGRRFEP